MKTLTSCVIDWTINGVAQTTYPWTGNLPEDFEETVTLGYFTPIKEIPIILLYSYATK